MFFTANLALFGTAPGRFLGGDNSKLTMTNKRIIANNGVGVWTVDIADDIVSYEEINKGVLIFKEHYHVIMLNKNYFIRRKSFRNYGRLQILF